MYTILLQSDKSLVATMPQTIYQNENAADTIRFLLPEVVDDVSLADCTVFVSYIRSDNRADVDRLEPLDEPYKGHLDYRLKMASRITKVPGKVCLWLQVYSGEPDSPIIMKSGEHELIITAAKNMDEYLADVQVSAMYRLQYEINKLKAEQSTLTATQEDLRAEHDLIRAEIPDDLMIHEDRLHLSKEDTPMGDGVELDKFDETIIFGDIDETGPEEPDPNPDDVIIFGQISEISEEPPKDDDSVIMF